TLRDRCRRALPARSADARHRILDLLARVERREPEVTLARRTEARARRADHLGLGEQAIEEVPRRKPARGAEPDVRRVDPAMDGESGFAQTAANDGGVLEVEADDVLRLGA